MADILTRIKQKQFLKIIYCNSKWFSSSLQVNLAYENVKEVDGLDISKEGTEMWEAALKRYDERIDRVEVSSATYLKFVIYSH